ncbi:MAG TPA: glucose 1-dehydrogenase [Phycisphaeraceae bacterium]
MAGRLQDKVAIVTGGATGIGEAISHKFAREGAKVVVAGLPDDPVQAVVDAIHAKGGTVTGFLGDLSNEETALACVRHAVQKFGRLDVLVNNAGQFPALAETQDYPTEDFERMMRANNYTVFFMTKHALPELRKTRGNIVTAGSEAGIQGLALNTPYGGTKAWNHAFMCGVAVEQAKYGVRANCVCPGAVDTAWTHKETGPFNAQVEKMVVQATPMGRRGTPEEIANVYAFIASDEASYMTGSLVCVDGGITVSKGAVGEQVPAEIAEPPKGELELHYSLAGLERKPVHRLI